MSKLREIRERHNLTQEELSEKSGISVRTIQRIESGTEPKGHTLKILTKTLDLKENELIEKPKDQKPINFSLLKIINISSVVFAFLPPVNIALPLSLMFIMKQVNPLTKQIVSVQIIWSILAIIIFMLSAFMKNWFSLGNKFSLVVMVVLVLSNVFIILRNAAEIDKKGKLYFKLNFSII
ncbi:helix-turn-helix domain-containing protein [Fulvivirgaceae bacterium LMO-SS25]